MILKAVIAALALISISATPPDKELQDALIQSDNRSAFIKVWCANGASYYGSGFFLEIKDGSKRLYTASHVLACNGFSYPKLIMVEQGGNVAQAFITKLSKYDIAELTVTKPFASWRAIERASPMTIKDQIVCVESSAPTFDVRCGRVHENVRVGQGWPNKGTFSYWMFTVGGTSGSPVLNRQGKLIGVHVGGNTVLSVAYYFNESEIW